MKTVDLKTKKTKLGGFTHVEFSKRDFNQLSKTTPANYKWDSKLETESGSLLNLINQGPLVCIKKYNSCMKKITPTFQKEFSMFLTYGVYDPVVIVPLSSLKGVSIISDYDELDFIHENEINYYKNAFKIKSQDVNLESIILASPTKDAYVVLNNINLARAMFIPIDDESKKKLNSSAKYAVFNPSDSKVNIAGYFDDKYSLATSKKPSGFDKINNSINIASEKYPALNNTYIKAMKDIINDVKSKKIGYKSFLFGYCLVCSEGDIIKEDSIKDLFSNMNENISSDLLNSWRICLKMSKVWNNLSDTMKKFDIGIHDSLFGFTMDKRSNAKNVALEAFIYQCRIEISRINRTLIKNCLVTNKVILSDILEDVLKLVSFAEIRDLFLDLIAVEKNINRTRNTVEFTVRVIAKRIFQVYYLRSMSENKAIDTNYGTTKKFWNSLYIDSTKKLYSVKKGVYNNGRAMNKAFTTTNVENLNNITNCKKYKIKNK